jgi:hypothetical protein
MANKEKSVRWAEEHQAARKTYNIQSKKYHWAYRPWGKNNVKMYLRKIYCEMVNGFGWFRIRYNEPYIPQRQGISWQAAKLSICSIQTKNFTFFFNFLRWGETESTWYVGHYWPYCSSPGLYMMMSVKQLVEWELVGEYSEKTCPNATLSTTNPTWPDLGSNPRGRGGRTSLTYVCIHH